MSERRERMSARWTLIRLSGPRTQIRMVLGLLALALLMLLLYLSQTSSDQGLLRYLTPLPLMVLAGLAIEQEWRRRL